MEALLSLVFLVFMIVFLVKIENMEFDNKHDERRHWREERRRWRQERHRRWESMSERWSDRHQSRSSGLWTGILLIVIGTDYFLVNSNPPILPEWMWSWEVLLIGMGLFIGIRHNFRSPAWFILMVVGGVFLLKSDEFAKYFPGLNVNHIWPVALIILGLFFILRPRRHRNWHDQIDEEVKSKVDEAMGGQGEPSDVKGYPSQSQPAQSILSEDFIDTTSIFGGIKKNIISKNFKGGDITNIMGGSEIDLTQADIHGTVSIDLTQVFGGTKLIVPSNWQVKAQMAAIFGGVEDKRSVQNTALDPNKILILDGTSIFGGIEIRSY
jgi:predicted membrane protein